MVRMKDVADALRKRRQDDPTRGVYPYAHGAPYVASATHVQELTKRLQPHMDKYFPAELKEARMQTSGAKRQKADLDLTRLNAFEKRDQEKPGMPSKAGKDAEAEKKKEGDDEEETAPVDDDIDEDNDDYNIGVDNDDDDEGDGEDDG